MLFLRKWKEGVLRKFSTLCVKDKEKVLKSILAPGVWQGGSCL